MKLKEVAILAYTAGIIDGEGNIGIWVKSKGSPSMAVGVVNTEEWICQWLKMQFGGSVCPKIDHTRKRGQKQAYSWCITSNQGLTFLKLILPYLHLKRPQAELAIQFQETRRVKARRKATEEELAVAEAQRILMKNYNKRGK